MADKDYNHDGKNDWIDDQIEQDELQYYADRSSGTSSSSNLGCSNALLLLIAFILGVLFLLGKLADIGVPTGVLLILLLLAGIPLVKILNMKA